MSDKPVSVAEAVSRPPDSLFLFSSESSGDDNTRLQLGFDLHGVDSAFIPSQYHRALLFPCSILRNFGHGGFSERNSVHSYSNFQVM